MKAIAQYFQVAGFCALKMKFGLCFFHFRTSTYEREKAFKENCVQATNRKVISKQTKF